MDQLPTVYRVLVLSTFNVPILIALGCLPFVGQLSRALKEKSPLGTSTDSTSYSRVAGLFGAVVISALFWAVGNLVLLEAFTATPRLQDLVNGSGRFFLIGSALFMPYAFNQLRAAVTNAAARRSAGLPGQVFQALPQTTSGTSKVAASGTTLPTVNLLVMNLSSTIDSQTLESALGAITIQITQDFAPEWGVAAALTCKSLTFTGTVSLDAITDAVIYLADSSEDPTTGTTGLLGYHSENLSDVPYGFVYLDVCGQSNVVWSLALSHEILELLADPTAAMTVSGPDPRTQSDNPLSVNYHLEVCDPTNGDSYEINNVAVSNFVTKRYFGQVGTSLSTNHLGFTLAPFGVRPGGYIQYDDASGVNEVDGSRINPNIFAGRKLLGACRRNARRAARIAAAIAAGRSRRGVAIAPNSFRVTTKTQET